jgi:ABC-type branched-chain amino acid transport systems, periplasmic component
MTFHAYTTYSRYSDAEPPPLARGDRWPGFGPRCVYQAKAADDTIKVGVLHSLSGTMAISETTLKDTILS